MVRVATPSVELGPESVPPGLETRIVTVEPDALATAEHLGENLCRVRLGRRITDPEGQVIGVGPVELDLIADGALQQPRRLVVGRTDEGC